jgi:hypothetical protein
MQIIFGNCTFITLYLDDITIHSKTFDDHVLHVKQTIDIICKYKLKLKKQKCVWFASEIKLLGHIVSGGSIKMDPLKIQVILDRQPPTNKKQVQEFLGLPNYYRKFIKNFSEITLPISNLLKQNVIFNWDDNCNKAFNILKDKLTSYPILQQPDFTKKFVLHCDASGYALGVILCQIDFGDKNYFNTESVISYASRILKGAEINYGITQKECLSIVWGVKQFHTYLYGIQFVVITDHIALSWLNHTPPQNGRLARWAMYLQEYQFDVVYRKGTLHSNVDAISRPVLTVSILNNNEIDDNDDKKNIKAYNDSYLMHYLKFKTHLPGASKRQLKRIMRLVTKYKLDLGSNTLYYRKNENVEYVKIPKIDERSEIIERAHLQGHFNAQSTLQRIQM